jgi:hypothetical protein
MLQPVPHIHDPTVSSPKRDYVNLIMIVKMIQVSVSGSKQYHVREDIQVSSVVI